MVYLEVGADCDLGCRAILFLGADKLESRPNVIDGEPLSHVCVVCQFQRVCSMIVSSCISAHYSG
jgi:hypothetical protein